jgi:hypothetical protein
MSISKFRLPEFSVDTSSSNNTTENSSDKTDISNKVVDSVVESVINKFRSRSELGIKKYGTTLDRDDLTQIDWANHVQEELMDAILYLEKLKKTLSVSKELNNHMDSPLILSGKGTPESILNNLTGTCNNSYDSIFDIIEEKHIR